MRKLTLCFITMGFVACAAPSQRTYTNTSTLQEQTNPRVRRIADVPSGLRSYDLRCVNTSICWIGDYLTQWRTVDAGQHWELIYSSDSDDNRISAVEYVDAEVAWLLTHKKLLKTEDGGRNWTEQPSPLPHYPLGELRAIEFSNDGQTGWAGGGVYRPRKESEEHIGVPPNLSAPQSDRVLRPAVAYTGDGGKTWISQSIPHDIGRISAFTFLNEQQGIAFERSRLLYTVNGGRQWKYVEFKKACTDEKYLEGYDMRPVNVSFLDSKNAWLLLEDGRITYSNDGARTWCDLIAPTIVNFSADRSYLKEIHFLDLSHGFGLAANGSLYETNDGGKTWARVADSQFDDMVFLDAKTGWLVSSHGLFQISSL